MQYVGLDASNESVVAVWKNEEGSILRQETLENTNQSLNKLAELLNDCKVAVEASTAGSHVYDLLSSLNVRIVLANPSKIRLIAESEKKTDLEDAIVLADLLRVNLLPLCYSPPHDVLVRRELVRQRKSFVEMTTQLKNKIRACLTRSGLSCPFQDLFSVSGLKWLERNALQYNAGLVTQLISVGSFVETSIKRLNDEIDSEFSKIGQQAVLLDSVPGVSTLSAVIILSEVGDVHRFSSPKQLCSYAGLVPRVRQSGEVCRHGHVKTGNNLLKTTLVQDANAAIRCNKRFKKFYCKIARKKGHQKAIVAVARKMLCIMWFMLKRNELFNASLECGRCKAS